MKLGFVSSILAVVQLHHVEARLNGRKLQAPTSWDDCVGKSEVECEKLILRTVIGDLTNHPIPDLKIKYIPQRSPELMAATYWMYQVATNIFGEVYCDLNGGKTKYRFDWHASDGNTYTIPDVECAGLSALECCDAVDQMMMTQGIPTTSSDGKCFSCWVHQQPLTPVLNSSENVVEYLDHKWDPDTQTCVTNTLTSQEVIENDQKVISQLIEVRAAIKAIMEDPDGLVVCRDIQNVRRDVLLYGRAYPRATSKVSGLLCGQCESGDPQEKISLTIEQHEALHFIHSELATLQHSDQNEIIIHTNPTGTNVLTVPQIGSSASSYEAPTDRSTCQGGTQPDGLGGCMCPAIQKMAGNQVYWTGNAIQDTAGSGYCECPAQLVEYNSKCFCPGGYKLWNPVLFTCVCPHGTKEDGSCICPGPFSGLDWNNVGWIPDDAGSCKVDFDCTLSSHDYYDSFQDGCNRCQFGFIDDGQGNCVCDEANLFVFDSTAQTCICPADMVQVKSSCVCQVAGAVYSTVKDICQCPDNEVPIYGYGDPFCGKDTNDGQQV